MEKIDESSTEVCNNEGIQCLNMVLECSDMGVKLSEDDNGAPTVINSDMQFREVSSLSEICPPIPEESLTTAIVDNDECNDEKSSTTKFDVSEQHEELFLGNLEQSEIQQTKRSEDECSSSSEQSRVQYLEEALIQAEQAATISQHQFEEAIKKCAQQNVDIKSDLLSKLETVTKKYELADKDKQSMVIKYANSEKEVIIVKKQLTKIEKDLRDAIKDKETLQKSTRTLLQENTKRANAYDKKVQEYGQLSRQADKLREEINAKDIKAKWREHKLTVEIEAHKETQQKLDKELSHRKGHESEMALVKKEAAQFVSATKTDEQSRANVLDKLYNEAKAKLITGDQRTSELNTAYKAVSNELGILKNISSTQEDELLVLRKKLVKYESEREVSEKLVTSLQAEITSSKINETNLSKIVSNSSGISEQLEELKKEYLLSCETVKNLKENLSERESEFVLNQSHEKELLAFTQKISDRDAMLQSQLSASKTKVEELQLEHHRMLQEICRLKTENESLSNKILDLENSKEAEVKKWSEDFQLLDKENTRLKTLTSDMKNELTIQQRKYQNIIKNNGREVIKLKTKLDILESKQSSTVLDLDEGDIAGDSEPGGSSLWTTSSSQEPLSRSSNGSSTTSLNNIDGSNGPVPIKNHSYDEPLSTELLLEKLLKLQRKHIRKEEKIEFLEEHIEQLVDELKRKSKILYYYFLKEDHGALSNCKSDDAKAEIIKKGGIMASVYGSSLKDGSMTLELSLEINKKLQGVLEDTLLKNITLKDNLNTLADEVATLTSRKLRA